MTWPFSVVDFHGVRLLNSFDLWILRAKVTLKHVPHARKGIFDSGNLSRLLWPDLDPDPYLLWQLCSQGILNSPLMSFWLSFEQKLLVLPTLGFIIQKRPNLTFDLTLTWELTRDLLGGGAYPPTPRFFLNNVHSVTDINAKLGIPFCISILRPHTKNWEIFLKIFLFMPI